MYRIFIGYDSKEPECYHVLSHSIMKHAKSPVSIAPLKLELLPLWRERNEMESTEFSFSRFLVPFLSDYEGWSLFMDCDMLVTQDITKLFQQASERFSMLCVQHKPYKVTEEKFLGQHNTDYQRKNWSSVMLFNNKQCQFLTPRTVNNSTGLDLHRFRWLEDYMIGNLDHQWNHLVGEQYWMTKNGHHPPANIHWTLGGPWFEEYKDTDFAQLWHEYKNEVRHG